MSKKNILIVIFLTLFPIIVLGQESNADYDAYLSFLKGDGSFETWFMSAFTKLDVMIFSKAISASLLGRAIGGFGMLIYLGYLGFQMQEGARPWEVTPMIKPVVIGLILTNWVSFTQLIQIPFEKLAQPSIVYFNQIEEEADAKRVIVFKKQNQLLDIIVKERAKELAKREKTKALEEENGNMFDVDLDLEIDKILAPIQEWMLRTDFKMQQILAQLIEAIGLLILRVAVYLIFFIQKVWSYILIVLGPIAVGLALIPGFESSLYNWVSKFININLFTFIAYTVINIGQQLIISGYEMEINRYNTLVGNGEGNMGLITAFLSNGGLIYILLFHIVAYLVTAVGVLMTPTIADTIVTAGGGQIASKMRQNTGKVAGGMMKGGKSVGSGMMKGGKFIGNAGKSVGQMVSRLMK